MYFCIQYELSKYSKDNISILMTHVQKDQTIIN